MSKQTNMYIKDLGDGFKSIKGNFEPENPSEWEKFENMDNYRDRVRELSKKYEG